MTTAADLPLELIQEIFLISASRNLSEAAILARISHQTYNLIKPILFSIFVYSQFEFEDENWSYQWPCQTDYNWLKINGQYARNLHFNDGASSYNLHIILSSCPNLTNIALWLYISKGYLPSLLTLRPHRLSIYLNHFFEGPFQQKHALLPMFNNLTHLDLGEHYDDWDSLEGIQHLPRLTHLSLTTNWGLETSIISNALRHCKHLAILILYEWEDMMTTEIPLESTILDIGDYRIVSFECDYLREWELVSRGGSSRDMWTIAEEIVRKRPRALNVER
ncbi:hypothetical protein BDN72DRAFT_879986 [Pluteus cervinus]|uniref:Uncharacterized protein n=1 Tax=Pluteus cervinus TaxID=181527 RepID=A0ACD3AMD5_9AGAR|nr:hypothetical protein BDN72DRAFT_879986 [Pluteus cervinus]